MSTSYLDANDSPNELIEEPGSNVRRMNKIPVLILFTLCLFVVIALIFAVFQRTQANVEKAKAAKSEGIVSASESVGSIFDSNKEGGIVPAAPEFTDFATDEKIVSKLKSAYGDSTSLPSYNEIDTNESLFVADNSDALASVPPPQYNTPNSTHLRSTQLREDLFYEAVIADTGIQYAESTMTQPGATSASDYDTHGINRRIEEKRRKLA
ncbi:MAG: hypothetical protein ACPGEF_08000, partial [Endozoicomonas sp.]